MLAIQGEFGGPTPIVMSNYYAGGSYVPSGTSGTNGPVPTSGAISIASFYGTQAFLETHVMAVGNSGGQFGYSSGLFGTLTPSTSPVVFSGAAFFQMYTVFGGGAWNIFMNVSGFQPNSGFTNLILNGTILARTSATYSFNPVGGGTSGWQWVEGSNVIGTSGTIAADFN